MSYNRTNKIHNPFEGEELEKGRFNLNQAEKQIRQAVKIIDKEAKQVKESSSQLKKAANLVYGAGNFIEALTLSRHIAPKRSRPNDAKDARRMAKDLQRTSNELNTLSEKMPFFEPMEYLMELVDVTRRMEQFNKK